MCTHTNTFPRLHNTDNKQTSSVVSGHITVVKPRAPRVSELRSGLSGCGTSMPKYYCLPSRWETPQLPLYYRPIFSSIYIYIYMYTPALASSNRALCLLSEFRERISTALTNVNIRCEDKGADAPTRYIYGIVYIVSDRVDTYIQTRYAATFSVTV